MHDYDARECITHKETDEINRLTSEPSCKDEARIGQKNKITRRGAWPRWFWRSMPRCTISCAGFTDPIEPMDLANMRANSVRSSQCNQ
jgi:hypothetical protein